MPPVGVPSSVDLSKLTIRDAKYVSDHAGSNHFVFHVKDPHALIQAAGYLKYIIGAQSEAVFFRGQSKLYDALSPTLFRGVKAQMSSSQRINALKKAIASIQ